MDMIMFSVHVDWNIWNILNWLCLKVLIQKSDLRKSFKSIEFKMDFSWIFHGFYFIYHSSINIKNYQFAFFGLK